MIYLSYDKEREREHMANKVKRLARRVSAEPRDIQMVVTRYKLNGSLYIKQSEEVTPISKTIYENILGSRELFETVGGKERYYRGYNRKGERVITKIISTSPDKTEKVYRTFIF